MKITYPLSLKVSLWLLLNMVLLAVLGAGFFLAQGGPGWAALVAGVAGDRAQSIASMIAAEMGAANPGERDDILARFGATYGAEFFLFRGEAMQVAGAEVELPAEVEARLEYRGFAHGFRGEFGPPGEYRHPVHGGYPRAGSREVEPRQESTPRVGTAETDPFFPPREPPYPARDREYMRFLVRAGAPAAFWTGFRVPFAMQGGRPGGPAMLIARIDSFWGLLRFYDLQTWLLAGTGVFALSVVFWLPLVRGITSSLRQLTAATEQIAEGRFETRVPADRRDEIGSLGESVNRMAARLDTHLTGQKRFLGDVAHELCSPLARLQMATGILTERAPPALAATVSDVREEVHQMSTLVNELLAFTKAGLQSREVTLSAIDVPGLVREVLEREEAAGVSTVAVPAGLRVLAEPDLLKRALANLVRNAVRYAGHAGEISLSARRVGDWVSLVVDDEGPGVPPEALDRLGEPFFRPEAARSRESGGVGLGLAIVRHSVAACRGEVHFVNRSPRGFRAEIRLRAG
jgi:two-component system, OmpR family, sensor histidine kinase CpxA